MRIKGIISNHILKLMDPSQRPEGALGKTAEELAAIGEVRYEKDLHRLVGALLLHRRIVYGYARFGIRSSYTPGWPDFCFCYLGCPCGWEIKTKTGKLSVEQEELHGKLRANGWRMATIRNLDEAKMILDGIVEEKTGT